MTVVRNIGKNTIGDNQKMTVAMHDYEMSNHDLSFVFRNTQSPGTLVPFLKLVAQKGDVFDIDLVNKTLTHPTVGPLFGSYKLQHFVFTCPIRLYNSWLHNNRLGIGMKMSDIKLPLIRVNMTGGANSDFKTNSSSLLNYMGFKGTRKSAAEQKNLQLNALPILMYGDIFKNYFANKQESKFYYIGTAKVARDVTISTTSGDITVAINSSCSIECDATTQISIEADVEDKQYAWDNLLLMFGNQYYSAKSLTTTEITNSTTSIDLDKIDRVSGTKLLKRVTLENAQNGVKLTSEDLSFFDDIRDTILQTPGNTAFNIIGGNLQQKYYYNALLNRNYPQAGLLVKTYDSDVFQNWVNTEWIDGDNGINEITAVDVSDGKLTMDSLNLAQKVYNMLNRIAVSGGTYRDWLETVYTAGNYMERPETPVFEGGMTQFIEFDEVISQSATEEEPLGTLAGRGKTTGQRGSGKLHFKVSEPSYIIGLVAITPMIDYSQGNDWDIMALKTMDDFHKPALDGIGYEDSMNQYRAWWTGDATADGVITDTAVGKTVAWINYMTNYNKTFGNFASGESESFMCLNRNYERGDDNSIEDLTTYIDPSKHNEIFADTNIDAMNFWVQTAVGIKVRRNISAKQIPNL